MNQFLTLGQCSAPVAAVFRRPTSVRVAQLSSRSIVCTAIPAASGQTPSTSQPSDQITATPRLQAVLQRVVASKARQASNLTEGASTLDR